MHRQKTHYEMTQRRIIVAVASYSPSKMLGSVGISRGERVTLLLSSEIFDVAYIHFVLFLALMRNGKPRSARLLFGRYRPLE